MFSIVWANNLRREGFRKKQEERLMFSPEQVRVIVLSVVKTFLIVAVPGTGAAETTKSEVTEAESEESGIECTRKAVFRGLVTYQCTTESQDTRWYVQGRCNLLPLGTLPIHSRTVEGDGTVTLACPSSTFPGFLASHGVRVIT